MPASDATGDTGQQEPVDVEIVDAQIVELGPSDPGYDATGVPTFESVREKIEMRYDTSVGAAELDAETPVGRSIDEQYEARQKAAAERLEQIRAAMRDDA